MFKKHAATMFLAVAGVMAIGASAQGAFQLLQFQPNPVTDSIPEFTWTGPGGNYQDQAGVHNAIEVDTPLAVNAGGGTVDANGTHYLNATLTFSSSGPNGAGDLKDTGAVEYANNVIQTLSDGSFTLTSADNTVLLTGTMTNNYITFPVSSTSSGFQGASVTYTGGAIYNAAVAQGLGTTGSTSISMVSLDGPIGINQLGGTAPLLDVSVKTFQANATGVFDVVPEPASLSLLAIAGLMAVRRRRA